MSGGNIPGENIPGRNVPGGVYLEPEIRCATREVQENIATEDAENRAIFRNCSFDPFPCGLI